MGVVEIAGRRGLHGVDGVGNGSCRCKRKTAVVERRGCDRVYIRCGGGE